jgi:[acyl-carrier-protein] S-malonyltransferase
MRPSRRDAQGVEYRDRLRRLLSKGRIVAFAILFPGQGSQYAGMADPWLAHPAGAEALDEASSALGRDLVAASRDPALLEATDVAQPALLACDVAAWRVLEAEGVRPVAAAGHSLGEFAALVAAGVLSLEDAVRLVGERGRAMQAASDERPGAMAALLGVSAADGADICAAVAGSDVLVVANENAPKQVVLSGSVAAIERAEGLARERRARAVRLPVAGAFHSPLMEPAVPAMREPLARTTFADPRILVAANVTGALVREGAELRALLDRHIVSPVLWERSMRALGDAGVDTFVEAGPGDVLTKLVKRILPGAVAVAVGTLEEAIALAAERAGPAPS